jgi:hypothetical protein
MFPKPLLRRIKQARRAGKLHRRGQAVDYVGAFETELAQLCLSYEDNQHGWKEIFASHGLESLVAELSTERSERAVTKLAIFLTFQLHRESGQLGDVDIGNEGGALDISS